MPRYGVGVMSGRADGAERVAGAAGHDGVDGVQDAAGGARGDVPGIAADVGVAGAQNRTAGFDVAAGDGEILGRVAEQEFVCGGGARRNANEARRDGGLFDRVEHGVEAFGTLGMSHDSGEMLAIDGVGQESGGHVHLGWRQFRNIPTAAQRFDQQHAGVHAAPQDIHFRGLILQRDALRGDHFQIRHQAALVAVEREVQRLLRRLHGHALRFRLLLQNAQAWRGCLPPAGKR